MKTLFDFKNYRDFLKYFILTKRKVDRKYSISFFSTKIGASEAYLKGILSGSRNLDLDKAFALTKLLGLTGTERQYFLTQILENDASTQALKNYFKSQLMEFAKNQIHFSTDRKMLAVFEDDLTWEIFSLIGLSDFEEDAHWIKGRLKRRDLSELKVKNALAQLLKMGSIQRSSDGKLIAKNVLLPKKFNPTNAYRVATQRSLQHLNEEFAPDSSFNSFCLIINEGQFDQIKEIMEDTKKKILELASDRTAPKTHLAHLNLNLFYATR